MPRSAHQPLQPAKHYAACCKSCHEGRMPKLHPVGNGNCVACHMPRREAQDGGHSVFTDHRIARRPQVELQSPEPGELVAWREPEMALQQRNLALAYVTAGITDRSPVEIVHGYRMLTEVQQSMPDDIAVLNSLGTALLLGKKPLEALKAFERVLQLSPQNPMSEQNVGMAYLDAGQLDAAAAHLERSLELDPILLPTATTLAGIYRKQGDSKKEAALAEHMRRAMTSTPAQPASTKIE